MAKIGKGNKTQMVKFKLTLSIFAITRENRTVMFIAYIIVGPRYILTLETSSVILFIKSPILFSL